jgi:uncharacterized membrane protein
LILGDACALTAAALWAVASVLFKQAGARTRPLLMNLVKSVLGLALFLPVLLLTRPGTVSHPQGAVLWLILSGVIGIALGDTFYFVSLARIGVRRTMMLGLLAPLFAAASAALAGQRLPGTAGLGGILLTLSGIFLVLRAAPLAAEAGQAATGATGVSALLFGVLSALCQALGIVMTKGPIEIVGVLPASVLRLAAGLGALLLVLLLRLPARDLAREALPAVRHGRLLLASFLGTFIGFYLFQEAIRLASPPVTAALVGTSPIFAAPMAAHALGERMPWQAAAGTLLAAGGVALVMLG